MTAATNGLVVHIAFEYLADVIDTDALQRIAPGATLLTTPFSVPYGLQATRSAHPDAPEVLAAEPPLTEEQQAAFAQANVLLTLDAPRDLPTIAPNLRWVQTVGSGIGQFRASKLDGSDIVVTNAAGVSAPSISEWVVGRIFSIYKRFDAHAEQQREHVWRGGHGDVIAGKRVVIVGLGAIGEEVAWRCGALGMEVVGVRRRPVGDAGLPRGVSAIEHPSRLHEVVASADVVVACVPGSSDTEDLFDAGFFAAMPEGSVFLNVGRGMSVDENALADTLRSGHLRAAAIDVAKQEPLPADDPLWDVPNLAISPHSSASLATYMQDIWSLFLANLEAFVAGRPLRNVVDVAAEYGPG